MNRQIKVGKYFIIPIDKFIISSFDFTKFIRIQFVLEPEDNWDYELEIWGDYQIKWYGKEHSFNSIDIEGYKHLLDFSNEEVKSCKADKSENLWLNTTNKNELIIEDGPFENWQFKIHKRIPRFKTKSHLIGGVGSIVMFKER